MTSVAPSGLLVCEFLAGGCAARTSRRLPPATLSGPSGADIRVLAIARSEFRDYGDIGVNGMAAREFPSAVPKYASGATGPVEVIKTYPVESAVSSRIH